MLSPMVTMAQVGQSSQKKEAEQEIGSYEPDPDGDEGIIGLDDEQSQSSWKDRTPRAVVAGHGAASIYAEPPGKTSDKEQKKQWVFYRFLSRQLADGYGQAAAQPDQTIGPQSLL
jgi:hypothetical protein